MEMIQPATALTAALSCAALRCSAPRSYVLSHLKDLVYLDYQRVTPAALSSAIEAHQVHWLRPGR